MTLREWLVLIGIIVIVGVLVDGFRRMRLAKKRESELSFGLEDIEGSNDAYGSELPNGGARKKAGQPVAGKQQNPVAEVARKWQQRHEESAHVPARNRIEPDFSDLDEEGLSAVCPQTGKKATEISGHDEYEPVPTLMPVEAEVPELTPVQEEIHIPEPETAPEPVRTRHAVKPDPVRKEPVKKAETEKSDQEKLSDRPMPNEILIINLKAKTEPFDGDRLLQSLLNNSMRYGDRSIFHRYARKDGTGHILFSLANGVEPGTFDINKMDTSVTPAISLFMSLPGPKEAQKAFTLMEETARQLALDLGAELKDENYSVLTHQTIEHYRQRIREFERKQLALRLND